MAVTFYIAGYLSALASGEGTVVISETPETVDAALCRLWEQHLALRDRVLDEQGNVRQHVNIFVDGHSVKRGEGLLTPITNNAEIYILPAVSGG